VTLKIEKIVRKRRTTVRLIGRVQAEDLEEVAKQLATGGPGVVLELDEVTLVDVDAVRFLNKCAAEGVRLINCSPYIREWMSKERNLTQG
jgi:anti-anti-sigma regulatory factor